MHPSHQRLGVEVFIPEENNKNIPSCPHGPMLLFERYFEGKPPRRFFSCSACRDRKECNFFQWEDESPSLASQKAHKQIIEASKPAISQAECWKRLKCIRCLSEAERTYCHTCEQLVLPKEINKHKDHEMKNGMADRTLSNPSYLFKPLDKKKSFAQYLFSSSSVNFLLETFGKLGYTKILCVGTPRIHEAIQAQKDGKINSLLMDLDHRYAQFNEKGQFIHYNMFNHHFFEGDSGKSLLQNFFQNSEPKSTLIILDPPFGGLVEVLAASVKKLWKLAGHSKQDKGSVEPYKIPTIWIFPYFMEKHIIQELPSFKMCEFKVDYDNHPLYKKHHGTSSKTSPVRIFTNVPLRNIVLPPEKGYRYCEKCERYVDDNNVHCQLCNDCTSKDGRVWIHCSQCGKCVKKGRIHCQSCDRCELPEHVCQRPLRGCHICGSLDHKRKECPQRKGVNSSGRKRKRKTSTQSGKSKKRGRLSER
ncbi:rRNA N6-adenosine-methyltransferase ZCCHC4-like isoform X2 [Dendronephthya gigantea]|uniref:rRNA N6-adenosine-methyltransferase ZCCHC4-like isoform X2 n=1 Tax=Dendronephthya gigantea TaxID=151771 RepID=UPI00106BA549|nr:rRNA N6-adenosine-methyltransferase ZCCHC4-like isoform X2 [Dendronephthya gigantea]